MHSRNWLCAAMLLIASAGNARAAAHLTGTLTGGQQVPPVATPATGTGSFLLSDSRTTIAYRITVDGLSAAMTAAHLHNAPPGANGPIALDITGDFVGDTASGTWTNSGPNPLTPSLVAEILAGNIYVNVHTGAHPGGEIRAQLEVRAGVQLGARLTGDQESPPVATPATGTAAVTLTEAGLRFDLSVADLSGPITAVHFHKAGRGTNGPVARDISGAFAGNTANGLWTSSDPVPLTPTLIDELLLGNLYLNVHTGAHPGGEIRGQVEVRPSSGYTAQLDGGQESPPVATPAMGTAVLSLNPDRSELAWDATVEGLTGTITGAHIHHAPTGVNGPIVRNVTAEFSGNSGAGVWKTGDANPLTPAMVAELLAGNLYLNVHTTTHPGGEIRGQLRVAAGLGFTAGLDGLQPVPPTATPATGTGSFTLGDGGLRFDVTIEGLTGAFSVAHLHNAPAGVNGPVVRDVTGEFGGGNTASGTWTASDPQALTPAMIAEILDGNIYLNIHSSTFPGGEIRGQVGPLELVGITAEASPTRRFRLAQNVPNPFNPTTMITYDLPMEVDVELKIFNVQGHEITTLVEARQSGLKTAVFDATGLPSGIYFYRLQAGEITRTRKLVLSK